MGRRQKRSWTIAQPKNYFLILNLKGMKLSTDALQFAYKLNIGISTCTWTVTDVVEFFTHHGNPMFGAAMDKSKAFDMVSLEELFKVLSRSNVEPIFLRLLVRI